jgi:hypothetical protein
MAEPNGFNWRSVLDAYHLTQEIFQPLELIDITATEINETTHVTATHVNNIMNDISDIPFIRDHLSGNFNLPFNLSFDTGSLPAWSGQPVPGMPSYNRLKPYLDHIFISRVPANLVQLAWPVEISGAGNMIWNHPMGAVIEIINLPSWIGRADGDPPKLFDAGIVGWGQLGGWHGFERLEFERTSLIPVPPGTDRFRWVLPPSIEAIVYAVTPKVTGL